jgi:putative endonuclease
MASGTGAAAEAAVARWLTRRGWRIAARNWHGGGGELDLVALRGGVLAVVEVKARSDPAALTEPVRAAQATRLRRAAEAYLARHPHDGEVRMDLAAVRRIGPINRVRMLPGGAGR